MNFDTNKKKIMFMASYIRGAAFAWFEHYIREQFDTEILEAHKKTTTIEYYTNLQSFIAKLVELYRDDDKERAAKRKLNRLRQTDIVSHYLSQFEQLAPQVQQGDFGLKNRFYEGLKDVVKDDIARGT